MTAEDEVVLEVVADKQRRRERSRMARRVWSVVGIVALVVACTTIMGLAIHIVDVRNARRDRNAIVLTLLCRSQATSAHDVNAVVLYVQSAGAKSTNPNTRRFLDGLPLASVPVCKT